MKIGVVTLSDIAAHGGILSASHYLKGETVKAPKGYFKSCSRTIGRFTTWFKCTGEFRPPAPGEFYVSGGEPEVYEMPSPLPVSGVPSVALPRSPISHFIAIAAPDPPWEIEMNGFVYRLAGAARVKP